MIYGCRPQLIVSRIAELGLSLSELSLQVGKNHAYFQQFIKRGVPGRLPEEVRGRVAEILKIDERQLKAAGTEIRSAARGANATVAGGVKFDSWIPVYGQAVGGKDGEFVLNGNQVTEVLAPASLSSVRQGLCGLCGGRLDGAALFRRRNGVRQSAPAGQPRRLCGRADFALSEDNVPHAYVKRFVSQDSKRLRLEQYNPTEDLEFPAAEGGLGPPHHHERRTSRAWSMSAEPLASREHDHDFLGARHSLHERRTWAVVALTSVMMVAEIGGGTLFGSMALVADGLHMATHVAALSIAAIAYSFARRHVGNDWFSFGTGKLGDLAAFAAPSSSPWWPC